MNPLQVQWERIRRRWLLILLIGVVAAGASAGAVALEPDSFTGRATLTNVSPDEGDNPERDIALTQGYVDYFNQVSTQDALRDTSGADRSVEVTARLAASGPILYVETEADTAALAGETATKLATALRDNVNAGLDSNGSSGGGDPEKASNRLRDIELNSGVIRNPTDVGRTAYAALVGGLLLGALGAIALGRFENRLVAPYEVRDRLGLDVLAVVPGRGRRDDDATARREVLRSLMRLADADGMPRPGTLIVTGPSSTRLSQARVALALAGLRARQGRRTLLVQADPEGAGVAEPTELTGLAGVTDFLGEGPAARLAGRVRSDGQGMLVCPLGSRRSDLHALYSKTQFQRLLDQAAATADLVIVNAPPVDTVEGRAACAAADRSLLVIEEGRTRAKDASAALEALGDAGATALGAVLVRDPAHLPDPGVLTDGPWYEVGPAGPTAHPGEDDHRRARDEPVATAVPARTTGGDP